MEKHIYVWKENVNEYGSKAYYIENQNAAPTEFTLKAMVSQNPDDPMVLNPGNWHGTIYVNGGLIFTPLFADSELNEALLCAEIMLALDWDYNKWREKINGLENDTNNFLSCIYNSYLKVDPFTDLRSKFIKHIC